MRPTWPDELARPSGWAAPAEASSSAAEFTAPQATTNVVALTRKGPADEVVHAGVEVAAVAVAPDLTGAVAPLAKDGARRPVLLLLGQEAAALQQQYARATVLQRVGEGPAAGARADDRDVGVPALGHTGATVTRRPLRADSTTASATASERTPSCALTAGAPRPRTAALNRRTERA